jgi:hypothetical protein
MSKRRIISLFFVYYALDKVNTVPSQVFVSGLQTGSAAGQSPFFTHSEQKLLLASKLNVYAVPLFLFYSISAIGFIEVCRP